MREVVIVSSVRTPVGRAFKGTLRATRPDELGAIAIKGALDRVPQLDLSEIEDVILGCAMPEAEQGMNVARIASLRAGLPVETSAMTINRFCSSGLQAIALAAERIMSGQAHVIVAGGTESMSLIPMGGNKVSPNPWLMDHYPDAYLGMGLTAENLAKKYGITREQADEFSLRSHKNAIAAIAAGNIVDVGGGVVITGGDGEHAGHLPVADDLIEYAGSVLTKRASAPEGQVIDIAENETLTHVKVGIAIILVGIALVLEISVVH